MNMKRLIIKNWPWTDLMDNISKKLNYPDFGVIRFILFIYNKWNEKHTTIP